MRSVNGRKNYFNNEGYLTRTVDGEGKFIEVAYDDENQIKTLTDHLGGVIEFTFNAQGVVEKLDSKDAKYSRFCHYRYGENNSLIESKDTSGNVFKYDYDDKYNMTRISYPSGKLRIIKYYVGSQFVKSIKHKDDSVVFI